MTDVKTQQRKALPDIIPPEENVPMVINGVPMKKPMTAVQRIKKWQEKYDHLLEDQLKDLGKLTRPIDRIVARDKIMQFIFPKTKAVELVIEGGERPVTVITPTDEQFQAAIEQAKRETGKSE